MNKIRIGHFTNKNTWLHNIEPKLKLITNILLLIINFAINSIIVMSIFDVIVVAIYLSLNIDKKYLLRLLKFAIPILVLTFVFDSWMNPPSGDIYFNSKDFKISHGSITLAILISMRVYTMVLIAYTFSLTTRPLDATKAIEDLLSPLKVIKFPIHIIAMVISIAFQFAPSMTTHAKKVAQAQAARGYDIKHVNWFKKIESIRMIWIPMLAAAFNNALQLGYAMDARAYDPYSPKSSLKKFKINIPSIIFSLIVIVLVVMTFLAKNEIIATLPSWWW